MAFYQGWLFWLFLALSGAPAFLRNLGRWRLRLLRGLLPRLDRGSVSSHMSDDSTLVDLRDQRLLYPGRQLALGKLGERSGEGGLAGHGRLGIPAANAPQLGIGGEGAHRARGRGGASTQLVG